MGKIQYFHGSKIHAPGPQPSKLPKPNFPPGFDSTTDAEREENKKLLLERCNQIKKNNQEKNVLRLHPLEWNNNLVKDNQFPDEIWFKFVLYMFSQRPYDQIEMSSLEFLSLRYNFLMEEAKKF